MGLSDKTAAPTPTALKLNVKKTTANIQKAQNIIMRKSRTQWRLELLVELAQSGHFSKFGLPHLIIVSIL